MVVVILMREQKLISIHQYNAKNITILLQFRIIIMPTQSIRYAISKINAVIATCNIMTRI